MHKIIRVGASAIFLWMLSIPAATAHNLFNIGDIFTGTFSGSEDNCIFPPTTDTFNGTVTLAIADAQQDGSFTGSITFVDTADGESESFNFNGNFNEPDLDTLNVAITGPFTDGGILTFSAGGTVSGDTLTFSGSGFESGGAACNPIIVSAILTRGGSGFVLVTPTTTSVIATAPQVFYTTTTAQAVSITTHIQGSMRGTQRGARNTGNGFKIQNSTGRAGGDDAAAFGLWGSFSRTDFENDLLATAYDGDLHSFMGGVDYSPWEGAIVGVALGYETGDIDTAFNRGQQESDGFTIAPYFGASLNDSMNIDATIGLSRIDIEQFRLDPTTSARISSTADVDRWFVAANLNGFWAIDAWILSSRLGFLYANQDIDSFTESNGTVVADAEFEVMQINFGGEAAYSMGEFEPYASATYGHDFATTTVVATGGGAQPANDSDDVLIGLGMRYFGDNGLSGTLEWLKRVSRKDFDEDTFSLSIRKDY